MEKNKNYVEFDKKEKDFIEDLTMTNFGFIGTKIEAEKCLDIIDELIRAYINLQKENEKNKEYIKEREEEKWGKNIYF